MGRATGSRIAAISAASSSRISVAPMRRPNRPSAMLAATLSAVSTPMSDWISSSSRLSSIASSSTRPFSAPSSRPTRPGRSGAGSGVEAAGSAGAGGGAAGASSMMASSPSSIFEDDLNSRSLSLLKNAISRPVRHARPSLDRRVARCNCAPRPAHVSSILTRLQASAGRQTIPDQASGGRTREAFSAAFSSRNSVQAARNRAAISGPMTKPLIPKIAMPPSVETRIT